MKDPLELLKGKIEERGIPVAKLADRCEIKRPRLYQAFATPPHRKMTIKEFLLICVSLDLEVKDFFAEVGDHEDTSGQNKSA